MHSNGVLSIFEVRNIISVPLTAFLTNINPHNRGLTRFFFCGRQLTKLDHITKIVDLQGKVARRAGWEWQDFNAGDKQLNYRVPTGSYSQMDPFWITWTHSSPHFGGFDGPKTSHQNWNPFWTTWTQRSPHFGGFLTISESPKRNVQTPLVWAEAAGALTHKDF